MARKTIPDIVLDDALVAENPRLENPKAESELIALRNILGPACEQVVKAYSAVADQKAAERAFKRFLRNLASAA
ncbi:hypothetical protein ABUK09_08360 [Pseudomonas aeruginosa]|uniref:hypothetical protein n=1 Tax=Pseudomonas aeruginosa TaxID=287 RepID=UPI001F167FA9|nr:hypothetical protein [Pseudomonas aeruginosa]MCF6751654.1 hypothetical protein [Stutzerimonas stutzeri]EKW1421346.1 hypothetical protein [Pseudomonas aeruginosa]ELO0615674.1 hypothetical protein [Pseudomonas aeruginosa]ELO0649429.1 hypothetical protein [Pseudomonas aeruginosa]ELQ4884354.1 hypothetical protein [Pseudomonas aeruginosa]